MAQPTETDETTTPGGGKKKIIILAVVLVAFAASWYFFMGPGAGEKDAKPVPGAVLPLEPVTVNLAGGGYLKVGLALQLTEDASAHGEPNGAKALDLTIAEFSQSDPARVNGKRETMQRELEEKIVEAYHGTVIEIYYTQYVAQ